jgi:hypothetical protein
VALTSQAFNLSADANPSICQLWHDVLEENPSIPLSSVETVYNSQNCSTMEP